VINIKFLLLATLVAVGIMYNYLFSLDEIRQIIFDEYISICITILLFFVSLYFRYKLKDKLLCQFVPNLHYVPIKSSIYFFIFFEIIDYYSEDGLIGMIKLWFVYWVFAVLFYFLTHNINYYLNFKAYKNKGMI